MYEKWIKMGPGARWPGKPDLKTPGGPPKIIKKSKPTPKGGRVQVEFKNFDEYDKTEEIPERLREDFSQAEALEIERINTEIEITRLVK